MTDRSTGDAAVTGVAKGSLGTGTALDETQEWVIPADLQGPEPAPAVAAAAAEPEAAPAPVADPVPVAAVVPAVTTRPRSPGSLASGRGRVLAPRTAGIAAVALLALIGGAAIVTSLANRDVPAVAAPAQVQPTTAPTDAQVAEPGGKGKDKDGGKGNGHGNGDGGGHGND
jgi:hypothetical protein